MIKPHNKLERITKENSMFNTLDNDYDSHTLKTQLWYYDTAMILQLELPKEDEELALIGNNYRHTRKTGLIKNECYYDGRVKEILNKKV